MLDASSRAGWGWRWSASTVTKLSTTLTTCQTPNLGFPRACCTVQGLPHQHRYHRHHHHHHRHHHHQLGFPENLLQSTRTAAAFSIATLCKSTGLWRFCHFGEIWTWISQDLDWNLDLTRSGFWIWICRDMGFGQFTWAWSLESKSPSSFLFSANLKENDKNAKLHPESIHHLNNRLIQPHPQTLGLARTCSGKPPEREWKGSGI